jgi:tetratricopeptide (TPR) repeat protein
MFALAAHAGDAVGPGTKDARSLSWDAAAAFRGGHYADAAQRYEAAFALRPDPVLLYNAAQSYRLAGNNARALELYGNYVRLYPEGASVEDARGHVSALKKVIEDRRLQPALATTPPAALATTAPGLPPTEARPPSEAHGLPPTEALRAADAPPSPRSNQRVPLLSRTAPAPADVKRPLTQEAWFWVAVGAAVAVVGATVILLASGSETFPDPTFGIARGN